MGNKMTNWKLKFITFRNDFNNNGTIMTQIQKGNPL